VIEKYLEMAKYRPVDWDVLMGSFFTSSPESPSNVLWGSIGVQKWERSFARIDRVEREPGCLPVWHVSDRMREEGLVRGLSGNPKLMECFIEAMKTFAKADDFGEGSRLRKILEIAGLVYSHLRCL